MKRRSFLRHSFHSLAVPGLMGSMGFSMPSSNSMSNLLRLAQQEGKVLVMVFLEGGNDGLNTVIPLDQLSQLNSVRPHVILPEERLLHLHGTENALHPALEGMQSLFKDARLRIIQNVGYRAQNFSHFRSSDIWMTGSESEDVINSGWVGRYLDATYSGYPEEYPTAQMPDPLSIEIGNGGSLLFQGPSASMGMVIQNTDGFYNLINDQEEEVPDSNAGDKLSYLRLIARQAEQYGQVLKSAAGKVRSQSPFPQTSLAQQLKIVSRLIAGGLMTPIYMVRIGGFDTHSTQVMQSDHTEGEHAELLKELDGAIMAFMADLERQGTADRVVGMTFSEFGRRIRSNASFGTDHGAAAPMFVFGNPVKRGVVGNNPVIPSNATFSDNLPWEFDFRQLYGSILSQWLGADSSLVASTLLKDVEQIEIIGDSDPILAAEVTSTESIRVFPNPVGEQATIRIAPTNEFVSVDLHTIDGKQVTHITSGTFSTQTEIQWDPHGLSSGRYLLSVVGRKTNNVFIVLKN